MIRWIFVIFFLVQKHYLSEGKISRYMFFVP